MDFQPHHEDTGLRRSEPPDPPSGRNTPPDASEASSERNSGRSGNADQHQTTSVVDQLVRYDVEGGGYGIPRADGGVDLVIVDHYRRQRSATFQTPPHVRYWHGKRYDQARGKEVSETLTDSQQVEMLRAIRTYGEEECRATFKNWPKCRSCNRPLYRPEDVERGYSGKCWVKAQEQLANEPEQFRELDQFSERLREAIGTYGDRRARLSYLVRTLDREDVEELRRILNGQARRDVA